MGYRSRKREQEIISLYYPSPHLPSNILHMFIFLPMDSRCPTFRVTDAVGDPLRFLSLAHASIFQLLEALAANAHTCPLDRVCVSHLNLRCLRGHAPFSPHHSRALAFEQYNLCGPICASELSVGSG